MVIPDGHEKVPLETDKHGVVRISGTRVTLESIMHIFNRGGTPEEIVSSFPTLKLADIYQVLAYALNHREVVDEYIRQRDAAFDEAKKVAMDRPGMRDIRERLIARMKKAQ